HLRALHQPGGDVDLAEPLPPRKTCNSCRSHQVRKLLLQLNRRRDDDGRSYDVVQASKSSRHVGTTFARRDVLGDISIVCGVGSEQPLSYVYAVHDCSSAGLLSTSANRSFPRRIWL